MVLIIRTWELICRKTLFVEDVNSQLHHPNNSKANQTFSILHGLMAGEFCVCFQLDRPEAVQDNKILYKLLEEILAGDATRSTNLSH